MQSKKKTILAVCRPGGDRCRPVAGMASRHAPRGRQGKKTITVQVLHKGGEERVFTLETGEAYLGAVLTAEGVVADNQGPYGLYMLTVDGETVDEGGTGSGGSMTKGGEDGQQPALAPQPHPHCCRRSTYELTLYCWAHDRPRVSTRPMGGAGAW